jgi:hypothetical protein
VSGHFFLDPVEVHRDRQLLLLLFSSLNISLRGCKGSVFIV